MASRRDRDEEMVIAFRGKEHRIPIHWRSDAEVQRRWRGGSMRAAAVDGFTDPQSGHIWISHEANRRKILDHELEHGLTEVRLRIWQDGGK